MHAPFWRSSVLSLVALGLPVALAPAACGAGAPPVASVAPTATTSAAAFHSISLATIDKSVSPGNDFFLYANGAWLKTAEIPADRSSAGVSLELQQEVEGRTRRLLEEATHAEAGSELRKIGDYYATFLDEAAIEARGLAPLRAKLDAIAKLGDVHALSAYLGGDIRADVDPLNNTNFRTPHVLGLWVEQDLNDSSRYAPYLLQGGLGMPDRSYYLDEAAPMAALRAKYVSHLAAMLRLAGVADAEAKAARVFAFEKTLAATHATREESEDVGKANNVWARADFAARAPGMDWDAFFAAAGLKAQASFVVWHPHALTGLAALVKSESIPAWREYLVVRAIEAAARFLPKAIADERFAFDEKEILGVAAPPPRWRSALDVTDDALGQAVGKAYVTKFFPPESKKAVEAMVTSMVTAFAHRIDGLAWMAPATKAKAKAKLWSRFRVGIGYPDAWRDYSALSVVPGDALGNVERAELFEYRRNVAKLGAPVDRGEWAMIPHIVNAVNLPVRNALNFPAGILVPPFFDPRASSAANYGGIGVIIGHEISHSFDDQGAKFDARGHYENWWTPEDAARFEASGAALAAQFSAYKPFPDLAVNGKQTLGENIADLGGIAAAYDAWRASLGGKRRAGRGRDDGGPGVLPRERAGVAGEAAGRGAAAAPGDGRARAAALPGADGEERGRVVSGVRGEGGGRAVFKARGSGAHLVRVQRGHLDCKTERGSRLPAAPVCRYGHSPFTEPLARVSARFHERDLERDRDDVPDDHPARLERLVPRHPEVRPLDLGRRGRADAGVAAHVHLHGADVTDRQRHLARGPAEGEIPGHVEVAVPRGAGARRDEGHLRMVLDVEEEGAPEVRVALRFAGVQRRDVDRRLDARRLGVGRVVRDLPAELLELSADVGDHQVADGEADGGVAGVEGPTGGGRGGGAGGCGGVCVHARHDAAVRRSRLAARGAFSVARTQRERLEPGVRDRRARTPIQWPVPAAFPTARGGAFFTYLSNHRTIS